MSHRAFDGYTAPQTANGVDGYATAIRAQSATGTGSRGGNLILSSGTGTTADGYVSLRAGTTEKLRVSASGTTMDGYLNLNALSIDGYIKVDGYTTIDGYEITFDGYALAPAIRQSDMPISGLDGYTLTVRAQSSTVNPARGGNLILRSGDGYASGDGNFRDGYINMYSGPTEVLRVVPNKVYALTGQRVNLSDIASTPFLVPDGYYGMLIDTSATAITIVLPINPIKGDVYQVKDRTGNAGTNNITVSGNGKNIDGAATYPISTNYGSAIFAYNGTTWSVL
jgi:hypothetical protein